MYISSQFLCLRTCKLSFEAGLFVSIPVVLALFYLVPALIVCGWSMYICFLLLAVLPYHSEFYTACRLGDLEQLTSTVSSHREEMASGEDNFSSSCSLPVNREGHTLLHIACQNGHPQLVRYLLEIGCDPSVR